MIQKVSKLTERQKGLLQSRYKEGNTQILLHSCKKDVILKKHKHKQLQFGYTFNGKYNFQVDEDIFFYINDCHSYLLNSYIYHEAVALSDYYALDIKYYGKIKNKIHINYQFPSKDTNIQSFPLVGDDIQITVSKILQDTKFELNKGMNFIVTKKQCSLFLDSKKIEILPMEIYKIDSLNKIVSHEYNDNEILIINLRKRV